MSAPLPLSIAATQNSPEIGFDAGRSVLTIRGESYPENSFAFYAPVFALVKPHLASSDEPLTLEIELTYLNTSSIKCIIDLLDLFEEAHRRGRVVGVNWHYDAENERALEMAEEFMEDVSFPFRLIAS